MVETTSAPETADFAGVLTSANLTQDALQALREEIHCSINKRGQVEELLADFDSTIGGKISDANVKAIRKGTVHWILGQSVEAVGALSDVNATAESQFVLGQALLEAGRPAEAIAQFEALKSNGGNATETEFRIAECEIANGQFEDAAGRLEKVKVDGNPHYFYLLGFARDMLGEYNGAIEAYDGALAIDEEFVPALFRKAYNLDLRGDDDAALELYEKLRWLRPVHINTMMNLGVIYEDLGDYEKAIECYKNVLETDPNHLRAQLYLKDAQASINMYYDEDLLRRQSKLESLLATPLNEFNLSVRVRHSLNQYNIQTLGDLIYRTEDELLSLDNFGKSSIKEIKELLSSKGLALAESKFAPTGIQQFLESPAIVGGDQIYEKSVDDFEWSKRVRKGFETLNIRILGDLVSKTEKDFMECRNFGQTSIREIKKKLASLGLSLRSD
jgi:DNA-directed RNA polymerase subunit alpha